jgi:hypothetical protein
MPGGVRAHQWSVSLCGSPGSHRRRGMATRSQSARSFTNVVDVDVDAEGGAVLKLRVT